MMIITSLPIAGAAIVETKRFEDQRGTFARLFCVDALAPVLDGRRVVQANHSHSRRVGALRGLHFQHAPHAEMKLIRCIAGRVWDVMVDLRADSPTFMWWHAEELSAKNARMVVIPEGCAHGFQVLEPDSELMYLHTAAYAPQAEGGLRHDDPVLSIHWPLPVRDLSARDASYPLLSAGFAGIAT